jgi:threonine aldolase
VPGVEVDPDRVQTNIVMMDVSGTGLTPAEFSARLKSRGVLINAISPTRMRLLTHVDVSRADCEEAVGVIREVAAGVAVGA